MKLIPTHFFLTKGVGIGKDRLASFESALENAKIAPFNIVKVSSILPPGCKLVSRNKIQKLLTPGEVIFCVMSENQTNEPHRVIGASIGVAIPTDNNQYGYLSEYHFFGKSAKEGGEYAENLAAQMLAKTLGINFHPNTNYEERKKIWKISGKLVKTTNITQIAKGDKNSLWTTVIAAAVLIISK